MNEDLLGKAIYCDCYIPEYDRYKILGSITNDGILEILRGHKNKTLIYFGEFMIYCRACGFKKYIKIESMAVNQPTYGTT
jgi:hypothetical protein